MAKVDVRLRDLMLQTVKEVGNDIGFSVCHRVWGNTLENSADYVQMDEKLAREMWAGPSIDMEALRKADIWPYWWEQAFDLIVKTLRESIEDEVRRLKKIKEYEASLLVPSQKDIDEGRGRG